MGSGKAVTATVNVTVTVTVSNWEAGALGLLAPKAAGCRWPW